MLEGKVAVVTGAGRGLGRAYARAMAAAGAAVVVNDIDADVADETVALIERAGGKAVAEAGAIGAAETADALVERAVEEFGRLDVMCANAGVLRDRTLRNTSDEDFDIVIRTHLRGTFTCGRAAVRRFREQGGGGRLILVGSPAGQRASFGQTAYSAAKAAIVGLVRTWALECERMGVTVNAVIPTALTRMVATIPGLGELTERAERGEPVPEAMRRRGLGTADDAAPAVVFLASDAAAGITGQCLAAGGDRLALWSHPQEVAVAVRDGGWTPETVAAIFPSVFEPRLQDYKQAPPPGAATPPGTSTPEKKGAQ
ncbi:dehydrogenase [Actinomadura sp. NBRC 104412]|uniref:SDR family NAD(P)-dependent oxidoreductase n=1 Tax=Actinomadura sp. NBRC 104412 TaxID=3032203 RepID=UPI0024A544B3|nr:SDR family oxidoreductase [Actinomadura sp. NBRC 104412]GLZ05575.1 dehydrogenase [Actinomadura sp. NBRC 104412]